MEKLKSVSHLPGIAAEREGLFCRCWNAELPGPGLHSSASVPEKEERREGPVQLLFWRHLSGPVRTYPQEGNSVAAQEKV